MWCHAQGVCEPLCVCVCVSDSVCVCVAVTAGRVLSVWPFQLRLLKQKKMCELWWSQKSVNVVAELKID